MQIDDGKGKGKVVAVNDENQMEVRATMQPIKTFISFEFGQAYSWASGTYNPATTGDTILLVKNTSDTLNLCINEIWLSAAAETRVVIHLITTDVTSPTGTAITGTNLNTSSSNVAAATAIRDETTNSQGSVIWSGEIQATTDPVVIEFNGSVILGKNKSIGVDYVADPTACDVTIIGHYQ